MWHAWERGEDCAGFWWETPQEGDRSENGGGEGMMELREINCEGVGWIHMDQDRDWW
jgi:hypothetical protein